MNGVVLDTNVLIRLFHEPRTFVDKLRDFDFVLLPAVVLGEFRAGLSKSPRDAVLDRVLTDYLANPSVRVAPLTEATSVYYAEIFRALKAAGRPIPQNDIWIAAVALEHAAPLFSYDAHFAQIPMLRLLPV